MVESLYWSCYDLSVVPDSQYHTLLLTHFYQPSTDHEASQHPQGDFEKAVGGISRYSDLHYAHITAFQPPTTPT